MILSVCLHTASGGIGTAAIQQVSVVHVHSIHTAGNQQKWKFLLEKESTCFGYSRKPYFALRLFNSICHVLNSLTSQNMISSTLHGAKRETKFIELSINQIWQSTHITSADQTLNYGKITPQPLDKCQSSNISSLSLAVSESVFLECPKKVFLSNRAPDALQYLYSKSTEFKEFL